MDVGAWLATLGLGEYEAAFRANAIDSEVLSQLTVDDLIELGVTSIGHRRKLLSAIARLSAAPAPAPAAEKPARESLQGERRQVAVLFADLVGYTSLTERLGAEAMHALLDAFFRCVDAVVERMGGRVDKHIGDCVMAVFGAPVAHSNDAERAVLSALEIQAGVQALAAERDQEIAVHVGVTMGSVVASYIGAGSSAEYAITGESVNLASRLTAAAGKGEILISDGLYRALGDRLQCDRATALSVKGFAKPVDTWRLLGLKTDQRRRAFVGRRSEVRQFEAILHSCLDEGVGQIALLRGEAGIGKTRLGEEFEQLARSAGFGCHRGLVLDFGGETGRDAIRMVVRDLLAIDPQVRGEALAVAAREAIANREVSPELEVHLNNLLDVAQPDSLRVVYDAMDNQRRQEGRGLAIAQAIRWAATARPRLLIVEDVHWAKPPLLRSLAQMARAVAQCPAILVITTRMEGDPLDKAWRAAIGRAPLTTIDLGPLRDEDAKQLCAAESIDPAAAAEIVSRAGGNPLFLQQLVLHAGDADAAAVPGTVQSLVQATIDQLGAADKATIQAAAVIGQRIDVELLGFLTGKGGAVPAGLIERGLLRSHGQEYLFVHALIRDAVYQSLLQATRRDLHLRAAQWFEAHDKRLHAEHLASADSPQASAAFLAAANEAIGRYHYETALGLLDRGLSLAKTPGDECALLLLKGQTLQDLGRAREAEPVYHRALAVAATGIERCQALIGLAAVKRLTDDIDGAFADLAQAEAEAVAGGLLAEQSRIHFLRGNLLFPRGDLEGCLREHEAGLRFAQLAGRPDLEAAALGGLGDAEYVRGRMASARRRLEQCVALAHRLGLGRIEVANHAQVAHAMFYTGPMEAFLATATEATEAASRVGHIRAGINARLGVIIALLNLGRYDAALAALDKVEEMIQRSGIVRFRQASLMYRGRLLGALGKRAEARSVLQEGLAFAASNGFAFHGPSLASALALVTDDRSRALELLDQAEAAIAKGCVGHNQYLVYVDGLDVSFRLKDRTMLQRYSDLLANFPPDEEVAWSRFHALRGRALLGRLEQPGLPGTEALLQEAQQCCLALDAHHHRLF